MEDKIYSIEDLLNGMTKPDDKSTLSPTDIWAMIANGDSLEAMGFSSEADKKDWISNNEYENI